MGLFIIFKKNHFKLIFMKQVSLIVLLFFFSFFQVNAQLTYKLTVVDKHQFPISGMNVYVKEVLTKEKIQTKTDANGVINLELKSGRKWLLTVGKMYNFKTLLVPEVGFSKRTEFLTYNLEVWIRQNKPAADRSNIKFEYIKQKVYNSTRPTKTHSVVHLLIKRANKKPLKDFPVNLTSG